MSVRPTSRWLPSLLAALILLPGCREAPERHAAGHEDGHDHEAQVARITAWTDRYEVFAEHEPPAAGVPVEFLAHVTHLKSGEPRREGALQFQLRLGSETPIEHAEPAPALAGIYRVALTFPKAGEWSVTIVVPDEDGTHSIPLPAVTVHKDAHDAQHALVPEPPEGVVFLKEQQWRVSARAEPATKRRLVEQLRLPATVAARPGSLARITPPVPGQLLLATGGTMPTIGDAVTAGHVLALLRPSSPDLAARWVEAEGEAVRAQLALEQAALAFQRIEKLAKAEARSGRELQEAEFARKTAQATYDGALAILAVYRDAGTQSGGKGGGTGRPTIELRAPISGIVVAQSGAAIGEFVGTDRALFTVLDAGRVFIEARVPEAAVQRLGTNLAAAFEQPGEPGRATPVTGGGGGRLVHLGIQVDATTRTVPLVYEAPNPNGRLRVGQSLTLLVETARAEDTLAIPVTAIVEEGGRPIVFVQRDGETFEKRDLTPGIRDGEWVQVLGGVTDGERVVTRGAYAIRLASASGAIPSHGHAH